MAPGPGRGRAGGDRANGRRVRAAARLLAQLMSRVKWIHPPPPAAPLPRRPAAPPSRRRTSSASPARRRSTARNTAVPWLVSALRAHAKPPRGEYSLRSARRVRHRLGGPGQWSGWTPWKERTSIASVHRARQLSVAAALGGGGGQRRAAVRAHRLPGPKTAVFGLLSTLRARAKNTGRLLARADSLRETRWAPSRRGPAGTAVAARAGRASGPPLPGAGLSPSGPPPSKTGLSPSSGTGPLGPLRPLLMR